MVRPTAFDSPFELRALAKVVIDYRRNPEDISNSIEIAWQGLDPYCEMEHGCAAGYTLSPDGVTCTKINVADPISQDAPIHVAASKHGEYTMWGTKVFDAGYGIDGSGAFTQIPLTNPYWTNVPHDLSHGPLNRCGVWTDTNNDGLIDPLTAGRKLSFSFSYTSLTAKTVYVGIAGDNKFKLEINNVTVLSKQIINVDTMRYWYIVPVDILAGYNLFTVTGEGDGTVQDAIALEIYENTKDEILAAVTDADLSIAFSSRNLPGSVLRITECPVGFAPVNDGSDNFICQGIVQDIYSLNRTGWVLFARRRRLINGEPDGFEEDNIDGEGIGLYVPAVQDRDDCPPIPEHIFDVPEFELIFE